MLNKEQIKQLQIKMYGDEGILSCCGIRRDCLERLNRMGLLNDRNDLCNSIIEACRWYGATDAEKIAKRAVRFHND